MTLLSATEITVRHGATTMVDPLSIELHAGQPLVILGETGSGKSLFAQALMGTLPDDLTARGRIRLDGQTFDAVRPDRFRSLWGRQIAVLPQEPWLSLDPLMRARAQVAQAHRLVRGLPRARARQRADADLAALGLSGAADKLPHQLSGGMAQRVAVAAARAGGAGIVIADEPTKGLDSAMRDDVADLLMAEMARGGGLIVITHDLALARRLGGQIMVIRKGSLVETGATRDVLSAPRADYTARLIAADPESWPQREPSTPGAEVLRAEGLGAARGDRMLFRNLGFAIHEGEVLGVTGPSGCGKSTLGDVILGLHAAKSGRVTRGTGRATAFQKLYQDPVSAFPARQTLRRTLADVAALHAQPPARIDDLMARFGLPDRLLDRRPDAVSGGELQRLSILRILLTRPAFVFADEPTSRLDPITQAGVMGILTQSLAAEGCAMMLVSHDRALVQRTSDRRLSLGEAPSGQPLFPTRSAQSCA